MIIYVRVYVCMTRHKEQVFYITSTVIVNKSR